MTKEQARVFVKAEKNKMTPAQIHENSRQIIDRLISQDFFYSADTVLTYVSYNQEVETHSFIDNCLSLGKTVLVPKVYGRDMKFHRITALSELKPGKYGILEPDNTDICEPEQGLMIMPGLAFDKEHPRAGYGGGAGRGSHPPGHPHPAGGGHPLRLQAGPPVRRRGGG